MAMFKGDFDITRTIKMIEQLKSQLLSNVSLLFSNMVESTPNSNVENIDILADIVILSYLLSDKLGVSNEALDIKINNKLKKAMVQGTGDSYWEKELRLLSNHLNQSRDINE